MNEVGHCMVTSSTETVVSENGINNDQTEKCKLTTPHFIG